VLSAGTLDSFPHNGAVVTLLSVCGVSHREGYFDLFMVAIVGALIASRQLSCSDPRLVPF
jgi:H+/gluconate symporter-like permease